MKYAGKLRHHQGLHVGERRTTHVVAGPQVTIVRRLYPFKPEISLPPNLRSHLF